jgi:hypothetical protein
VIKNRFPMEEPPRNQNAFIYGAPFLAFIGASLFVLVAGSLAWAGASSSHTEMDAEAEAGLEDSVSSNEIAHEGQDSSQKNSLNVIKRRFVKEFSAALTKGRVVNHAHLEDLKESSSLIQLPSPELQFAMGSAALNQDSAGVYDVLGAVLSEASTCLAHSKTDRKDRHVFLGSVSQFPCAKIQKKLFRCSQDFKKLDMESILLEGHADGTPYSMASKSTLALDKFRDNLDLSAGRAETVLRRLYTCAPTLAQVNNGEGQALFGIGGHSSQRSVSSAEGDSSKDRRVELKIHWRSLKAKIDEAK